MRKIILCLFLMGTVAGFGQIQIDQNNIVELQEIGSLKCGETKTTFINFHSGKQKFYWTYKNENETSKAKYESITFYGTDDYLELREWIFEHLGSGKSLELELGSAELSLRFDKDKLAVIHQEEGESIGRLEIGNAEVQKLFGPGSF